MNPEKPLSIYVHIPFCLKKCGYCDFHSVAMRPEDVPQREYVMAVCEELRQLKERYGLSERQVGTIYFGGGTPTTFEPENLNIILDAIHKNFTVDPDAEISIEANPETIPLSPRGRGSGVRGLLNAGFNRLSIGIQSFNDRQLQTLGRIHNADTARHAVRAAQEAGFKNIGIDLMWGLPGQIIRELDEDLDEALALGVQHISAYQLTVGEGLCPLPKFWEPTEGLPYNPKTDVAEGFSLPSINGGLKPSATLPSEELAHEMFLLVHNRLTDAGYEHYEISNFAKIPPGPPFLKGGGVNFRCRHNLNYWRYGEWLGVGSGATSFIQDQNPPSPPFDNGGIAGSRFTSIKNISKYLRHEFSYEFEEIPLKSAMAEYSFMNLRTSDGIDLGDFKYRFGRDFDEVYPGLIKGWIKGGWAEMKMESNLQLSLSGWLISDELFQSLV